MFRPEEVSRKAVQAYQRGRHAVHAQSNDQDDKTVFSIATEHVDYGDWVITNSNVEGHPNVSHAANDGDPEVLGVVQSHAQSNEWCRVATCGAVPAKVDPSESFDPGDWLALSSGNDYAVKWEDEDNRCGQFLYQIGDPSNGMAMVRIDSQGPPSPIQIHHHDDADNTRWSDTTGSTQIGYSWHLFRVRSNAYTGGESRLMLTIGGNSTHGETLDQDEGYAWGGTIGAPSKNGRGMIGGNEVNNAQGVLGLEGDETNSADNLNQRVNIRSYGGWNTRDRFGKNPNGMLDMDVGPFRFGCPDTQYPTWRVPTANDACNPPSDMKMWGGTMQFDKTVVPGNGVANWKGEFTPMLACEQDCCTSFVSPDEPSDALCEFVANRSQFESNARDPNGNYEWVIPYGWIPTAGRLDVLSAVCCHSKHISQIWNFLMRLTKWIGDYASCNDAFFATKADGSGAASTCCVDTGTITVPEVDCGPTSQDVDCAGNPISG